MRLNIFLFVLLFSVVVLACKKCEKGENSNEEDDDEYESKKEFDRRKQYKPKKRYETKKDSEHREEIEDQDVEDEYKPMKENEKRKEYKQREKYRSKKVYEHDREHEDTDEYDFIIVGGGTAGCTVANRLSQVSEFNILLLEAGGKPPLISQVPMLSNLMANTKYDWNYTSVPQPQADDRVFNMIQGKMLGGSQSMNYPFWIRANSRDFDLWAKIGARGWSWQNVLRYYRESENDYSTDSDDNLSGYNGPIRLTNPWKDVTIFTALTDELRKLGYVYVDPNGGNQTGFSVTRMNVYKSQRDTSYTAALVPVMSRKNLKVITSAMVEKVLFNEDKEAVGVLYSKDGKKHGVNARNEIILSAGAINTPILLMLSGIGPRKHLESLKIKVLSDLPVGDNLQDHVALVGNLTKPSHDILKNENVKEFLKGYGPLTNYSAITAFVNTDLSKDMNYPDTEIMVVGEILDSAQNGNLLYQLWYQLNRPRSRGSVRLQSKDINVPPYIDPNYLAEEYDMQVLIRLAQSLAKVGKGIGKVQDEYKVSIFDESSCENLNPKSDEYWRCIVRSNVGAGWEFCCTAPLNNPLIPGAVVDDDVRVIGVTRLRVVDASVFPTIPTANIQATVIGVAERCSDIIKRDHVRGLYYNNHPTFNDTDIPRMTKLNRNAFDESDKFWDSKEYRK